jgi:hypothetical protein
MQRLFSARLRISPVSGAFVLHDPPERFGLWFLLFFPVRSSWTEYQYVQARQGTKRVQAAPHDYAALLSAFDRLMGERLGESARLLIPSYVTHILLDDALFSIYSVPVS